MKAVIFNEYGDSSVLQVQDVPRPRPESHDVLIRVHAAGVNPLDWKVREGGMGRALSGGLPVRLGAECAGTVEAVGEMVTNLYPGDRVVASLGPTGGGYAEYAIAQDKNLAKLPDNVDFNTAAAMVVGGLTALQGLRDSGHLRPGDQVLINGASGGVGTFGVQLAKLLGGYVTAVCSADNTDLVRSLGADRVIDYHTTDFTQELEHYHRYNLIFDAVGKSSLGECRQVLAQDGIYVSTLPGLKQMAEMVGSAFTAQTAKLVAFSFVQEDMNWLLKFAADGRLKAIIDRTYSLDAVAEAHDYSESGQVRGKLIVEVAAEAALTDSTTHSNR